MQLAENKSLYSSNRFELENGFLMMLRQAFYIHIHHGDIKACNVLLDAGLRAIILIKFAMAEPAANPTYDTYSAEYQGIV